MHVTCVHRNEKVHIYLWLSFAPFNMSRKNLQHILTCPNITILLRNIVYRGIRSVLNICSFYYGLFSLHYHIVVLILYLFSHIKAHQYYLLAVGSLVIPLSYIQDTDNKFHINEWILSTFYFPIIYRKRKHNIKRTRIIVVFFVFQNEMK